MHGPNDRPNVVSESAVDLASADAAPLVDDDVPHVRHLHPVALHPVRAEHAHPWIGQQRKGEPELVCQTALRFRRVDADRQNRSALAFDVSRSQRQLPELVSAAVSGRDHIEDEHHVALSEEVRERDGLSSRGWESERGCLRRQRGYPSLEVERPQTNTRDEGNC